MAIDIHALSESDLQALRARLGTLAPDPMGRIVQMPGRQLHDLNLQPTAEDPRPLFVPSAASPRDVQVGRPTEYKKLMWSPDGREIAVSTRAEEDAYAAKGYVLTSPATRAMSTEELIAAEFASLPPEDQQLVIETAKAAKLATMQERLASLTPDERARVLGADRATGSAKKRAG